MSISFFIIHQFSKSCGSACLIIFPTRDNFFIHNWVVKNVKSPRTFGTDFGLRDHYGHSEMIQKLSRMKHMYLCTYVKMKNYFELSLLFTELLSPLVLGILNLDSTLTIDSILVQNCD